MERTMLIEYRDDLYYEYEIDEDDMEKFIMHELINDYDDREKAKMIYDDFIDAYGLQRTIVEAWMFEAKEYFREMAQQEYREYVLG